MKGPILDLVNKQLDQIISERSALELKCRAFEDKLGLLQKQLEANERHRAEYLARYEKALSDKQNISAEYSQTIMNLNSKCNTLEERCLSLSKALEHVKRESSDWKTKYDNSCLELQAVEEKFTAQIAALESRRSIAEGRLAAACEQDKSAVEEASEWKRKYDVATGELKTVLEKSTFAQKRSNKELQTREDALRAEFSNFLARKVIFPLFLTCLGLFSCVWCFQYSRLRDLQIDKSLLKTSFVLHFFSRCLYMYDPIQF